MTVNRYCSSGLETIAIASDKKSMQAWLIALLPAELKPCRPFHSADGVWYLTSALTKKETNMVSWGSGLDS